MDSIAFNVKNNHRKSTPTAKRTRPPGKRKIKEKIDLDYFVDDSSSTSSASEAELAEKPEFSGAQFHNYDRDKKYRDQSPDYHDDFVKSSSNSYFNDVFDKKQKGKKSTLSNKKSSSFNQSTASSTTNSTKRLRLLSQQESLRNSPTFLNTPLITIPPGYSTPSRKSFVLRDGFIFSSSNEVNSNMSPLSLHALEKPIPNNVLPFWDARFVRAIHESDEVDELVHCICDFKEESGLMIQCSSCLCWVHGKKFDFFNLCYYVF